MRAQFGFLVYMCAFCVIVSGVLGESYWKRDGCMLGIRQRRPSFWVFGQ